MFGKLVAYNFMKNFNLINANTIFNKAWWKMGLVNYRVGRVNLYTFVTKTVLHRVVKISAPHRVGFVK